MVDLKRVDKYRFEIKKSGQMRVPGIIYASAKMMEQIKGDNAPKQVINVACLPGIVSASLAMPDIHWGYGFPIGGVAAFDADKGIISPGGVGYDINCGVRLATLNLGEEELKGKLETAVDALFYGVPCGVGQGGKIRLSQKQMKSVLKDGADWAVKQGYGRKGDLEKIENRGTLEAADPDAVSPRAYKRGNNQIGTLGSGNHFLELGVVDEIFDPETAASFGLTVGQATLMIHSGSRGLGYQVCDDFLARMVKNSAKEKISLPDRQLACAYNHTSLGKQYFGAMSAAANYAWANRQVLLHLAEEILCRIFGLGPDRLGLSLVYDVCHNIAKMETHLVNGKKTCLVVHRKGATRAFGPGAYDLPDRFKHTGQPVLIPGDMGTESFVLAGTNKAMEQTFGSCCHGAGRVLSRKAAIRKSKGRSIRNELAERGITVRSRGRTTLAEEMPEAYKNVSEVVEVVAGAGIARKVARLRPLGVVKG